MATGDPLDYSNVMFVGRINFGSTSTAELDRKYLLADDQVLKLLEEIRILRQENDRLRSMLEDREGDEWATQ